MTVSVGLHNWKVTNTHDWKVARLLFYPEWELFLKNKENHSNEQNKNTFSNIKLVLLLLEVFGLNMK